MEARHRRLTMQKSFYVEISRAHCRARLRAQLQVAYRPRCRLELPDQRGRHGQLRNGSDLTLGPRRTYV